MSDEEKHDHNFDLPLFFNMSKQFLAPGVLVVIVFKLVSSKPGVSKFSKLVFGYVTEVLRLYILQK